LDTQRSITTLEKHLHTHHAQPSVTTTTTATTANLKQGEYNRRHAHTASNEACAKPKKAPPAGSPEGKTPWKVSQMPPLCHIEFVQGKKEKGGRVK
jgi:hypothetical protein